MSSTIVSYVGSNSQLLQSSLPLTLGALKSFGELPLAPLAALTRGDINDGGLLALTGPRSSGSGFAITVTTMGTRCGKLVGNWTSELTFGVFSYASSFDASTGASRHVFTCSKCFVDGLSMISFSLDASCQSLSATLAAASVGGGLFASSVYVANPAIPGESHLSSIAVPFPLVLEVIQDTYGGAPCRDSDGLVLGGRSAAGYIALASSEMSTVSAPGDASSSSSTVEVTISIPLQPLYTRYDLSPKVSLLGLFSGLASFISLTGLGSILLSLHEKAKDIIKKKKGAATSADEVAVTAASDNKNEGDVGSSGDRGGEPSVDPLHIVNPLWGSRRAQEPVANATPMPSA